MDFEDEDYVRVYTRDTATWRLLGWQGQTVLLHMLRSGFDRAGRFAASQSVTKRHGLSRAVTAVTGLPREVVEPGLQAVLDEGIWLVTENGLVWPGYVRAQTCARTDRARKRLERERKAAEEAGSAASQSVTDSHDPSQAVTKCHSEAEAEAEAEADQDPPVAPLAAPPREAPAGGATAPAAAPPPPATQGDPWGITPEPTKPPQPKPIRNPKPSAPRTIKRLLPDGWAPNDQHREEALRLGVDCDDQERRMRDWADSEGKRKVDWDATFRNWLRTSADRNPRPVQDHHDDPPRPGLTPEQVQAAIARDQAKQRAWLEERSREEPAQSSLISPDGAIDFAKIGGDKLMRHAKRPS